jgi:hypothetical protein
MKKLPKSEHSLVLRTDFSDDDPWKRIRTAIRRPRESGFRPYVEFVSDPEYDGLTLKQIRALRWEGEKHGFIFVVDHITFSQPDRPILVVDLYAKTAHTFRVIPSKMWSVENNLSIANMDFEEFAAAVDDDGIFRGFHDG